MTYPTKKRPKIVVYLDEAIGRAPQRGLSTTADVLAWMRKLLAAARPCAEEDVPDGAVELAAVFKFVDLLPDSSGTVMLAIRQDSVFERAFAVAMIDVADEVHVGPTSAQLN